MPVGSTNAERQRRYRRHKAGDHTLCDPSRCSGTAPSAVTSPVTSDVTRGQRLWRDERGDSLTGGRRALLEEACRIADRLDRLDAILRGDAAAWMTVRVGDESMTVVVDKVLAEARQQAAVLKQILAEIRQGAANKPESGGSVIDQLAARRAARRASPAS